MTKSFDTIQFINGEWLGQTYAVCIAEGQCDDRGDYPNRPPHFERDEIDYVFDEDGNDVTEWALKLVGREGLLNGSSFEIKP